MHAIFRLTLALIICFGISPQKGAQALTDAPALRWLIARQNADGGFGGRERS
jgi:hypothetical protein